MKVSASKPPVVSGASRSRSMPKSKPVNSGKGAGTSASISSSIRALNNTVSKGTKINTVA